MNNTQIETKIKKSFEEKSLPKVDVRSAVMDKIMNPQPKAKLFTNKKLTTALVACIFISTCGFAASKLIKMRNHQGDVIWSYNEVHDESAELNKIYDDKLKELDINPGEAVFLYSQKNNPTKCGYIVNEPFKVNKFSQLQDKMKGKISLPEMLGDFRFIDGTYQLQPEYVSYSNLKHLIGSSSEEVFVHPVEFTDKILNMYGNYTDDELTVRVSCGLWNGNEISYPDSQKKYKKIITLPEVDEFEVLYITSDSSSYIEWIYNEILYRVSAPKGTLSEKLTPIVRQLVEHLK